MRRTSAVVVVATLILAAGCTVTQTFEDVASSPRLVGSPQILPAATRLPSSPPLSSVSASATPNADSEALAANACSGTTYSGCVDSLVLAMGFWPGELVAICEYEGDQGDIVWVDSGDEDDAEASCSADGLIAPSTVFGVVWLP